MKAILILQRLLVIIALLLASSSALAGSPQSSASLRISIQKTDFLSVNGIQDLLFDKENPQPVIQAEKIRIHSSSQLYGISITSENGKNSNSYQLSDGVNRIDYQVSWGKNNRGLQIEISPEKLAELRHRNYTDTLTILIEQG